MQHLTRRVRTVALLGVFAGLVPLGVGLPLSADATSYGAGNLLRGDTATLAHGLGSWAPRSSRLSRPTRGVLAMKSTSSTSMGAATVKGGATAAIPNRVYSATAWTRTAKTSRQVSAALTFYSKAGKVLATLHGQSVADVTKSWTPTTAVVGVAPAGSATVAASEIVTGAAVGEVHFLTRPLLTVAPPARRGVVGPLRTVGNKIYDANGPVLLRGIHRRGLELTGNVPISTTEMAAARRWGATMIRLSVSQSFWLALDCHHDSTYISAVDRAVNEITSQHMVAMVDLHTNSQLPCGKLATQDTGDQGSLRFWYQVGEHFKSNPLVVFDLYNEPHRITDEVWLHGGWIQAENVLYHAAGMQQMYDAVRAAGARNLVFATGNEWGHLVPAQLLTGFNIVYAAHIYTCPLVTWTCNSKKSPVPTLNGWVNTAKRVPVVITEFGWPSPADGAYLNTVIKFAHDHSWGWIAFAWDGSTAGDFSLLSTQGTTFEPSQSGMPVLGALSFG